MRGAARRSANINVMFKAVEKAAYGLKRDFGEVENLQVSMKGPGDFVSAADHRAEKRLREELERARPGYGFLLEEGGEIIGRDPEHRWIIDPLDGTTNFLHGIPHFAISVALQRGDEIIAGIIYDVAKDEFFWAEKGVGAYLDNRRLRVSGRRRLNDCVLACGVPHVGRGDHAVFEKQLHAVMDRCSGVRRFGAASLDLAYVAAGRYDGYWETHLSQWDIAAGILMVTEAGGYIRDINGGTNMLGTGSVIAANDSIQPVLAKTLKKAVSE
ncbi:inositol monophosphatase family protein [uncultured Thalassospira sp.]|uniref:inositol monophosphatase family protein n=1 Tax=uncultured Thalassospira sp. TaxID=404382 RepID=UPI0030D8820C